MENVVVIPDEQNSVGISHRHVIILNMLSKGLKATAIGRTIGISDRTVEKHIERMKVKLGCKNTAHLVATAIRSEIID